jgi:hypothetical protein
MEASKLVLDVERAVSAIRSGRNAPIGNPGQLPFLKQSGDARKAQIRVGDHIAGRKISLW